MSDHLALYWESLGGGGLFRQGNLSIASANKSREDLAVAVNPLRELLRKDGCGLLAIVEALDEGRWLGSAAAFIESPANQSTVLVQIKGDLVVGHHSKALLSNLGLLVYFEVSQFEGLLTPISLARSFLPLASESGIGYPIPEHAEFEQRWP
jgi:hypothetical protein